MKSRDIAIVGILLAIGAILRYLSNIVPGAIVANPIIALYCLAIILIVPKIRDALGIGIVAGVVSALISHSIFPPANLISEPLGALVCLGVYLAARKRVPFAPGISTFVATLASGFTFLAISIFVIVSGIIGQPGESFTVGAFVIAISPIIILTAIANSVIAQILYIPSSRILMRSASGSDSVSEISKNQTDNSDEKCAIDFDNYSFRYPLEKTGSLNEINLKIKKGECVLVNGTTGAGKTTLCLAAAGILHHEYEGESFGTVSIFGKNVSKYADMGDIGRKVGVVFDDADAQLIFTTVEEEVLSGLENRGLPPEEVKQRLEEIMELTNIEGLRYRAPHTLSGGQKQRVALAATLASGTECLILDEATAELDEDATEMIISVLERLKSQGKTIIVIEQKPGQMSGIADRIITLDKGFVKSVTTPDKYYPEIPVETEECMKDVFQKPTHLPKDPVISIKNLVHRYGNERGLDGVSLEIYPGELVAIIGENGSGKTTLSKHLNGLLKPDEGEVLVCGINTQKASVTELARHAGLVFQNPDTMLFEDTIEKEILFGLKNIGKDLDPDSDYIKEVLDEAGLLHQSGKFPRSMSRGERQRLAISCVTAMNPEVIILDEPTTGLDEKEASRVMKILKRLGESGHTVIMVSHDMEVVKNHAKRIIKMTDGKISADYTNTGGCF
ncbi:ATP-binding cassette domain-containing protein [Methanoplanus sp. FWC-SCC4]|uniref:ATP-binding cassette domain-containing protein n=1 Tax=Methanochimaera problematica TaxID=2609417 RepID=A0AA97FC21_9EURY|nr:energy-coupling factor transporter ATPase [Methanoplanus sp. FWC-SCC4]WOF15483.1 ATP-binding cassette domain-containing protein [Methanoplanus sp. FWC-SCC4]